MLDAPRLTHRRRKEIASLAHRKYRERLGQCLVEGVRSVEAAAAASAPIVEIVATALAAADPRTAAVLAAVDAPVYVVEEDELAALSDVATSQGVLAVAETRLVPEADLAAYDRLLALDGVQDPGNVGTLLRTAAWFGVDAVVAGAGTVDLFNPKVVRAAMGGLWDVRLARTGDLAALLRTLAAAGAATYGADLGGTPATQWTPRQPGVLVLGAEAAGLSEAVRAALDERVTLVGAPGRAGTESLNVAVAGGVLLHRWLGGGTSA